MFRALPLLFVAIAEIFSSCGGRRAPKAVYPRTGTSQTGIASWYGHPYHGRKTASGEVYDMEKRTAAHREWAFGSMVRVLNLSNGKSVEVRINDRGPFVRGRIIDLSRAAARDVGLLTSGISKVRITVTREASRTGDAKR